MNECDQLLTDPRLRRLICLVSQFPMSQEGRARLLRQAAYVLEPSGKRCCEFCGEPFTPKRNTARFCSAKCRKRANRANRRRS